MDWNSCTGLTYDYMQMSDPWLYMQMSDLWLYMPMSDPLLYMQTSDPWLTLYADLCLNLCLDLDCLTDDIRKQAPWQMMSADDTVLCAHGKSKLEVFKNAIWVGFVKYIYCLLILKWEKKISITMTSHLTTGAGNPLPTRISLPWLSSAHTVSSWVVCTFWMYAPIEGLVQVNISLLGDSFKLAAMC